MADFISSKVSQQGRAVVARLPPGVDLLEGLIDVCNENKLTCGAVIALIGSLKEAGFIFAVPSGKNETNITYSEPVIVPGPLEFLSGQGLIGLRENGEITVHLHGLISDPYKNIYGGHFLPGRNPVLVTIEVLIKEFSDVVISRVFDEETQFNLFKILK
ncbi:MAG: PPC domain-containing DNA-binding protein [Peptococcaceae bacterium]